jgi:hypothetical protein
LFCSANCAAPKLRAISMSDSSNEADVVRAKQIAARIVRRHSAREAAKLNNAALRIAELESSLAGAQMTLGEQSAELTDAAEAVELALARVAELESERNAALADTRYHEKCFNQMLAAMQATSDYDHIARVLRRRQMQ